MVNQAAIRKARSSQKERREEREQSRRVNYKLLPLHAKNQKTGKYEAFTFSIITKYKLLLPLELHDFKGDQPLKTKCICVRLQYKQKQCPICDTEGQYGPCLPKSYQVAIVFVHNYVGRVFRKNGKRFPFNPIRVLAFPAGPKDAIWDRLEEAHEEKAFNKTIWQIKKGDDGAVKLSKFPSRLVKEQLVTKGVIPKEYREEVKALLESEEAQLANAVNAFQEPNFEHWGVEPPAIIDRNKDEDTADDSYPDEDEKEERRRKKKVVAKKKKPKADPDWSDHEEEDDADDEEMEGIFDDEDEDEEEPPKRKKAKKKPAPKSKKRKRDEEEEDDDDEEDSDEEEESEDEEDEEEEEPPKRKKTTKSKSKKAPPKKRKKRPVEDEDEEEDDDEDEDEEDEDLEDDFDD